MQTNFNSVTADRQKVPPADTGGGARGEPDYTWMAAWSLPEKKVAQFIEGILFKDHFKRELKQVVANRQAASEVLKVEAVSTVWNAATEAVSNDQKNHSSGSAPMDQDPEPEPNDDAQDQVTFVPPSVDDLARATIMQYQEQAFTIVDQSVTILVEANDEPGTVEMLRSAINAFQIPPPVVDGGCEDL